MIQKLSLKPAALLLIGELNSSKMLWLTLWATEGNLQALHTQQSCSPVRSHTCYGEMACQLTSSVLQLMTPAWWHTMCGTLWSLAVCTQSQGECVCSRYGHNELDDPTITLPLSYQAVRDHPPVLQLYASKLDEQAVLKSSQVKALQVSSQKCSDSPVCSHALTCTPVTLCRTEICIYVCHQAICRSCTCDSFVWQMLLPGGVLSRKLRVAYSSLGSSAPRCHSHTSCYSPSFCSELLWAVSFVLRMSCFCSES